MRCRRWYSGQPVVNVNNIEKCAYMAINRRQVATVHCDIRLAPTLAMPQGVLSVKNTRYICERSAGVLCAHGHAHVHTRTAQAKTVVSAAMPQVPFELVDALKAIAAKKDPVPTAVKKSDGATKPVVIGNDGW